MASPHMFVLVSLSSWSFSCPCVFSLSALRGQQLHTSVLISGFSPWLKNALTCAVVHSLFLESDSSLLSHSAATPRIPSDVGDDVGDVCRLMSSQGKPLERTCIVFN